MSEKHRFNLVNNGYDCYQVNAEVDRLEYRIQQLNEKNVMLTGQIEQLNNQFQQIRKRYSLLVSELSMREKQADDVARLALKEANATIEEAKKEADLIIQNAILEVNEYIDQIKQYHNTTMSENEKVRDAVKTLLETIDHYDMINMPDPFAEEDQQIED